MENQNSPSSDNFHAFMQSQPTRQRETTHILPDLLILILIYLYLYTFIYIYLHELIVKVLHNATTVHFLKMPFAYILTTCKNIRIARY